MIHCYRILHADADQVDAVFRLIVMWGFYMRTE